MPQKSNDAVRETLQLSCKEWGYIVVIVFPNHSVSLLLFSFIWWRASTFHKWRPFLPFIIVGHHLP